MRADRRLVRVNGPAALHAEPAAAPLPGVDDVVDVPAAVLALLEVLIPDAVVEQRLAEIMAPETPEAPGAWTREESGRRAQRRAWVSRGPWRR